MAVTRSLMTFTSARCAPLMAAFKQRSGRSPHEPDQASKEDDQAQLPPSEIEICLHGSHCVQGHYRGAASIFQSCETLTEPPGYAAAIDSKLSGKMRH